MKKVIAFGASNSRTSINNVLAVYVSAQLQGVEVAVLDLNDRHSLFHHIIRIRVLFLLKH